MLQAARAILDNPTFAEKVNIQILYANRSDNDILCHDTLTAIDKLPNVSAHSSRKRKTASTHVESNMVWCVLLAGECVVHLG